MIRGLERINLNCSVLVRLHSFNKAQDNPISKVDKTHITMLGTTHLHVPYDTPAFPVLL